MLTYRDCKQPLRSGSCTFAVQAVWTVSKTHIVQKRGQARRHAVAGKARNIGSQIRTAVGLAGKGYEIAERVKTEHGKRGRIRRNLIVTGAESLAANVPSPA
jgi:hypothetical protein